MLAVVGTSPAIVTETVWALALRKPPLIPHEIYLITTTDGQAQVVRQLFDGLGWDDLLQALHKKKIPIEHRLRFGDCQDNIRLLPSAHRGADVADILGPEDSAAAADCIMRIVREFADDPQTRIVAALPGLCGDP